MDVCFYIKSSATKNGIYVKKWSDWYDYYTINPTANWFETNIVLRFNEWETYKTKSNNTYDRIEVVAAFK